MRAILCECGWICLTQGPLREGRFPLGMIWGTMPHFYRGLCNAIPPSLAMWASIIWLIASW
jgi:hypothetical protein